MLIMAQVSPRSILCADFLLPSKLQIALNRGLINEPVSTGRKTQKSPGPGSSKQQILGVKTDRRWVTPTHFDGKSFVRR